MLVHNLCINKNMISLQRLQLVFCGMMHRDRCQNGTLRFIQDQCSVSSSMILNDIKFPAFPEVLVDLCIP